MNCVTIPVAKVLPPTLTHNFQEKAAVDTLHDPSFNPNSQNWHTHTFNQFVPKD